MKDSINFLHKISAPPKEFDARHFLKEIIATEIDTLRHRSHHGQFHEYVKNNGYPIPQELLKNSSYVRRTKLEKKLRNAIESSENIILPGCEGSGKTTLLHRVFGEDSMQIDMFPIYIDVSDAESGKHGNNHDVIYDKLRNSLTKTIRKGTRDTFSEWILKMQRDPFSSSFFENKSSKSFVESFFIFLQTRKTLGRIYVILDNIDSISLDAAKLVFTALNSIKDTVKAACRAVDELQDYENVRYAISCRTPTYRHISGPTLGLFIDFPHTTIEADDAFNTDLDVLELMKKYCLLESEYLFGAKAQKPIYINIGTNTVETNIRNYIEIVCEWLSKNRKVFNDTIKSFSGRSIRRSKLYAVKIISSPVIARLALFERYEIVSITRHDQNYLKRRLEEALLDFQHIDSINAGAISFPMNPFRVVQSEEEFSANPLLGIYCIDYLVQHCNELASEEIFFANTINVRIMLNSLIKIGYTENAIKDFFSYCSNSGLLRPVPSTNILLDSADEFRIVYEEYVIDKAARDNYWALIFFKNPRISTIFYNASLKAHFRVNSDHMIDGMEYELFCILLGMKSLIRREIQFQKMISNSGVPLQSFTSRIRRQSFHHISEMREQILITNENRNRKLKKKFRYQLELNERLEDLFFEVKSDLLKRPGII